VRWPWRPNPLKRRQAWSDIEAQMDSARIGTIHGLCAEILRAHPAEAGLDPQFGVVEESDTIRLRGAAVESALLWAVEQPEMLPLFQSFSVGRLQDLLSLLLAKRLEVSPGSLDSSAGDGLVAGHLQHFFRHEQVSGILADFEQARQDGSLLADAGDRLADQIVRLLVLMDTAAQSLASRAGAGLRAGFVAGAPVRDGLDRREKHPSIKLR
jgi:hypothetical protein